MMELSVSRFVAYVVLGIFSVFPGFVAAQDLILRPHFISGATPELNYVGNSTVAVPATNAYRMQVQTTAQVRCMLEEVGSGRVLNDTQRARVLQGVTLSIEELRGSPTLFRRNGGGPHAFFATHVGTSYFQCRAEPLPADVRIDGTTLAIEPVRAPESDTKMVLVRPGQRAPIATVEVAEEFHLQVHAFQEFRSRAVLPPDAVVRVEEKKKANEDGELAKIPQCERRETPHRRIGAPLQWFANTGTAIPMQITQPGDYVICVSLQQQNGVFGDPVEMPITVLAPGGPVDLAGFIIREKTQRGYIDARNHQYYTAQLTMRVTDPNAVSVEIANQTEQVTATLTNQAPGFAVFEARLRFADGLQIVKARVNNGGHTEIFTQFAMAGRELLGTAPVDFNWLKGIQVYATNDILEDSGGGLAPTRSLEALIKAIPKADFVAFFPRAKFNEPVTSYPAFVGGGRKSRWGRFHITQRTEQYARDVRVELMRGPKMMLQVEADLRREISYFCTRRGESARAATCPFEVARETQFDADFTITLEGPVDVMTRSFDQKRYLVIDWDGWTMSHGPVSVSANRGVRDAIFTRVVKTRIEDALVKDRIETLLRDETDLVAFEQGGRQYFGYEIMDREGPEFEITLPLPLKSHDFIARSTLRAFEAELGGDFLTARWRAPVPKLNYRYSRANFDVPRADFNHPDPPVRQDVLRLTTPSDANRRPDFALAVHVDTLNKSLAHYFGLRPLDAAMTPPEFVEFMTPRSAGQSDAEYERTLRASALGALMAFPNGVVSWQFEQSPRLAARADNPDQLSLELGPVLVTLDLDTRRNDTPKLVARVGAIVALRIKTFDPVSDWQESGIELDRIFDSCLSPEYQLRLLNECKSDIGVEIVEARGMPLFDVMPQQASLQDQALLEARYDSLFRNLGFAGRERAKFSGELGRTFRQLLLIKAVPGAPNSFLPLKLDLPDVPVSLSDPIANALGVNLPLDFTIRRIRPNVALAGPRSGSPAWIGIEGFIE